MEESTNPATEVEEAAPATEAVSTDQASDDGEDGQLPDTGEPPSDEFEEIDFDGQRYAVPKPLKEAFLRNADYTRKTQEVSEQRKALEAERAAVQQRAERERSNIKAYAELYSLDSQIEQYQKLDWDKLTQEDPVQAFKLDREHRQLVEARNQRAKQIEQKEQEDALQTQRDTAKRVEEGFNALNSEIKGWDEKKAAVVRDFVARQTHLGITEAEIARMNAGEYGPAPIVWAYKAALYDQLMTKAAAKPQTPPPKPVQTVGKANKSARDITQASSYEEFAAMRKRQIAQRR